MKKRLFAIMLALAMLLAAVPALAEEGDGGKDQTFENNENRSNNSGQDTTIDSMDSSPDISENGSGETKTVSDDIVKGIEGNGEHQHSYVYSRITGEGDEKHIKHNVKCSHEGCTYNAIEPHDWIKNVDYKPATCNADGLQEWTCSKEGCKWVTYVENKKRPDHQWDVGVVTKAATCKEEGEMKFTCTVCQTEKTEKVPKTNNHQWSDWIVETSATCTAVGSEKRTCSICDATETRPIPALGHSVPADDKYTVKPTCTTPGKATYKCLKCGVELKDIEIPALGHSYGAPVWSWRGFTSASATFTCTRNCGNSVTQAASIVRSSINNCGYYTYTATVQFNGKTYTDTRTDYSCRPDWYYDPCYYNNPCGHWGCGNVCTRYSNCVPCQNYRTTFRVGGYNCLATPKTGDVSVIGMALISLAGAGAAIMGKKRK